MPTESEIALFRALASDNVDLEAFNNDPDTRPTKPSNREPSYYREKQRHEDSRSERSYYRDRDREDGQRRDALSPTRDSYIDAHRDPSDKYGGKYAERNAGDVNGSYAEYRSSGSIQEKRSLLFEYRQLLQLHPELSHPKNRQYTMDDDMSSILFELERLKSILDINSNLSLMSSGLSFGCLGIETLLTKLRLVQLDGWSAHVSQTMPQYRPVLIRVYRRLFKKGGSMNPFLELFLALCTSAFVFSRKKSSTGPPPASYNYSAAQPGMAPGIPHPHNTQNTMNYNDFENGNNGNNSDDEMEMPNAATASDPYSPEVPPAAASSGGGNMIASLLPMLMGGMT